MTTITRDLLTRALPFLAPKAAALVTDFLMTEVFPPRGSIIEADQQQAQRTHEPAYDEPSYVIWRQISLWLFFDGDESLATSMLLRNLRELERNLSRNERPD
jgi:hypothetical protein